MRYPYKMLVSHLLGLGLLLAAPWSASASSIVVFGTSTPLDASATGTLTLSGTSTMNLSLTNTSTYDGRITALGFDLLSGDFSGNNSSGLNGYSGTSSDADFVFSDASLGNVAQFSFAVLDFGYTTGNSGSFDGGSPNDGIAPFQTINFMVTGNFAGLTEAQLASGLFVRFQRLGADGEGSDVGTIATTSVPTVTTPEPASMILLGTGLLAALRARRRKA